MKIHGTFIYRKPARFLTSKPTKSFPEASVYKLYCCVSTTGKSVIKLLWQIVFLLQETCKFNCCGKEADSHQRRITDFKYRLYKVHTVILYFCNNLLLSILKRSTYTALLDTLCKISRLFDQTRLPQSVEIQGCVFVRCLMAS